MADMGYNFVNLENMISETINEKFGYCMRLIRRKKWVLRSNSRGNRYHNSFGRWNK